MTIGRSPLDPMNNWSSSGIFSAVSIVKIRPGGEIATRYPGRVMTEPLPEPWIGISAEWTHDFVAIDGLCFTPGDTLHEYYSDQHPFNAFTVFAPDSHLRGWYANVTYPSWMSISNGVTEIYWHDLVVDVVVMPVETIVTRDEEELVDEIADMALRESILKVRDEIVALARAKAFPFHE